MGEVDDEAEEATVDDDHDAEEVQIMHRYPGGPQSGLDLALPKATRSITLFPSSLLPRSCHAVDNHTVDTAPRAARGRGLWAQDIMSGGSKVAEGRLRTLSSCS